MPNTFLFVLAAFPRRPPALVSFMLRPFYGFRMALSRTGVGDNIVFADVSAWSEPWVVSTDGRTRILLKGWCLQVAEMPGCQFSDVMAIQTSHSINNYMIIMFSRVVAVVLR